MYIRACEILRVGGSVAGSVGGGIDTRHVLWGARKDVWWGMC